MLVVHHLNNSRSQRVLWLLEELGAEYEIKRYQRDPVTMRAPPELKDVHPLGKSPVVTDDLDTVAETAVIIEHIINTRGEGRLRPEPGTSERARYDFWMHHAEGGVMPWAMVALIGARLQQQDAPFFAKPILRQAGKRIDAGIAKPELEAMLAYWDDELAATGWFAGDAFSAADVMMSFPVEITNARLGLGGSSNVRDWLDRIHARPAYHAALAKGGPYDYAGS